jgi:hypothetical protein
MTTLKIENLPDELYRRLQSLASEQQWTVNEAVIHVLAQSLDVNQTLSEPVPERESMADVLHRIRSRPRANPQDFGFRDSTVLIREDRDR